MISAIEEDLSIKIDNHRTLWLTEISRQTFMSQGAESLESDDGLFIVLEDLANNTFEILAKAASPLTAMALFDLIAASKAST